MNRSGAVQSPPTRRSRRSRLPRPLRWAGDSRAVVALEFAILSIPFFTFVLFLMELSYDLFTQEALDFGLHRATKLLARGNAQNVKDGPTFISQYLCPQLGGLLECQTHLYINVQKFPATGAIDYYDITTGALPVSGHVLNLAAYQSNSSFCNVAPDQFVLISVIYLGPTFVGFLLPNVLSVLFNGQPVHATLSTTGLATERFSATPASSGLPVASPC